jgi:hypothetical protein
MRLLAALGVSALTCSASPALGGALGQATWMGGPGCGGANEWRQHPVAFPYFCDGTAVVEGARWRNWGRSTATAQATFNEALLSSHNSVASAPRRRSAVTITASHIELCSGRRAYTSIKIRYAAPANGISTLTLPTFLPHCRPLAQSGKPGTLHVHEFLSPDRKVWCQINEFSPPMVACGTHPEPPTHAAEVNTAGHVSICSVPRLEYSPGAHVPNTCFQNWAEPVMLGDGKQTELDGFRCSSATNGITCTVVAGAGKGKGFRVNKDEAVEVG